MTSPDSPPTAVPPFTASITQLPSELITQIISYVNVDTARSLLVVHRALTPYALQRVWRDVSLRVQPEFGERPLVEPFFPQEKTEAERFECMRWKNLRRDTAEQDRRTEMIKRIDTLIERATERGAWGCVESLNAVLLPGSTGKTLRVLESATSLKSLEIAVPPWRSARQNQDVPADDDNAIDFQMMQQVRQASFPCLTHLRLGPGVVRYAPFIVRLCNLAPELVSLNVDLQKKYAQIWESQPLPAGSLALETPTKIRQLRIVFWGCYPNDMDVGGEKRSINAIVGASPDLRRLSLEYQSGPTDLLSAVAEKLRARSRLRDVHWVSVVGLAEIERRAGEDGSPGWTGLKRLVLGKTGLNYIVRLAPSLLARLILVERLADTQFEFLPVLPSLETIYLIPRSAPPHAYTPEPSTATPSQREHRPGVQSMLPDFADRLRQNPHLHLIRSHFAEFDHGDLGYFDRLDELEATADNITGYIKSYTHGGEEVLHARLLLRWAQSDDIPYHSDPRYRRPGFEFALIRYSRPDGKDRERVFVRSEEPVWQDFVDWRGGTVPMEVLEEMRRTEGLSESAWNKRGVEIGEAAWEVLVEYNQAGRRQ